MVTEAMREKMVLRIHEVIEHLVYSDDVWPVVYGEVVGIEHKPTDETPHEFIRVWLETAMTEMLHEVTYMQNYIIDGDAIR